MNLIYRLIIYFFVIAGWFLFNTLLSVVALFWLTDNNDNNNNFCIQIMIHVMNNGILALTILLVIAWNVYHKSWTQLKRKFLLIYLGIICISIISVSIQITLNNDSNLNECYDHKLQFN